jgi:hypothetical protein
MPEVNVMNAADISVSETTDAPFVRGCISLVANGPPPH